MKTLHDEDGRPKSIDKEYPVKMVDNKIIPTKGIKDENIKEIENFKFFAQYGSFKDLSKYKDGDISYNPEVPSYSAKYQLTNDDYNVKQLRKDIIPTNKAPKLLLKGTGNLKGSSVGYKDIEFTFVEKKVKIYTLVIVYILNRVRINNLLPPTRFNTNFKYVAVK